MSISPALASLRAIVRAPPKASSTAARSVMQSNRRVDTSPERRVRSAIHGAGLRYRVDYPIRVPGRRPIRPDIVFTAARVAVFVDGCFWHGCPEHGRTPQVNTSYWASKLELNRRRDVDQVAALRSDGWVVLRIWEHEDTALSARRIADVVHAAASRAVSLSASRNADATA